MSSSMYQQMEHMLPRGQPHIYTATLELNFISKDEVQTIASHAVYLYYSTVIGSNTNSSIMAQTQQQHWR